MTRRDWHLPAELPQGFLDTFWKYVQKSDGCWLWNGNRTPDGYGRLHTPRSLQPSLPKLVGSHRVAYELAKGPIPAGLVLDHLCKNPPCCNPAHLEAVTSRENNLRGVAHITHCPNGHAYEPDNRVKGEWRGRGSCKTCLRIRNNKRYHEKKIAESGTAA